MLAAERITVDNIRVVLADDHREVIAKVRESSVMSTRFLRLRKMVTRR